MAVVRKYLKCAVCDTVTALRIQLGWLKQHPIRIHCGGCGILITGVLHQDPEEATYDLDFQNASMIDETPPRFYMQASGELLTEKLQPVEGDLPTSFSPFLDAFQQMGQVNYQSFKARMLRFLDQVRTQWPRLRRINELWAADYRDYVVREARADLPEDRFPMNNELEIHRAVHVLNLAFLSPLLEETRFNGTTELLFAETQGLANRGSTTLIELVQHFGEAGMFRQYDALLLDQIARFVERFQFLIPVFSLQFYRELTPDLLSRKGLSTTSFEDLKQLYLDHFEVAGEALMLVVAFNNLKHRGRFSVMKPLRGDVTSLVDFSDKSKGVRIAYVDGSETFDVLVSDVDNSLRNAIGHASYDYDGASQLITYYPGGHRVGQAQTIYLLEFGLRCLGIFMTLVNLSELAYQGAKIFRLAAGDQPVDPGVFSS